MRVLTVAYPQLVLVVCSMDWIMSTPIWSRYGSLVAWYRYMVASMSSMEYQNREIQIKTKQ
ncbi:hypothetical protein DPMN_001098 [Dreissena polymorpha]|uniref:Uncharacterized protein n=1 Tax=Dreissena polymorpha TaxID=45954 RepID=A0A9D4MJA4_DREPO|nr:hypothetical protein DPMN_001098 [Dreissena polymorpha]